MRGKYLQMLHNRRHAGDICVGRGIDDADVITGGCFIRNAGQIKDLVAEEIVFGSDFKKRRFKTKHSFHEVTSLVVIYFRKQ